MPESDQSELPESGHCQLGLDCLARGEITEAIAALGLGLSKYPHSVLLLENRARAWMLSGDFRSAKFDLEAALALDPESPGTQGRLHLARAVCLVHQGAETEAHEAFSHSLPKFQDCVDDALEAEARCAWAAVLMSREQPKEALEQAQAAQRLAPEDQRYGALVDKLESYLGQSSRAERIAELEDRITELLHSKAGCQALPLLEELLLLAQDNPQALQWLGAAYHQQERFEEELQVLTRSFDLDGNEVALFNRAICHLKLKHNGQACEDFARFIEISKEPRSIAYAKAMLTIHREPSKN